MIRVSCLTFAGVVALAACGGGDDTAATDPVPEISIPKVDDAVAEQAFAVCSGCHSVNKGGPAMIGPNLYGIIGEEAGQGGSFRYSGALRSSGIIWTVDNLDAYIADPQGLVSGTSMAYPGESDPEKREAMIAWLAKHQD